MTKVLYPSVSADLISRVAASTLPPGLTDPHGYISQFNEHVAKFLEFVESQPADMQWDILTPGQFKASVSSLPVVKVLGAFIHDQVNQADAYGALTAWKTGSLLRSLLRSVNTRELLAPALLARGLLEHAVASVFYLAEVIQILSAAAQSAGQIRFEDGVWETLERKLHQAIWGTKVGTSKLKGKKPLWDESPYEGESAAAENVVEFFRHLADREPDLGKEAFKAYEWLCDLVHPATQGLRVFWREPEVRPSGRSRYSIDRSGGSDQLTNQALVLWTGGFSVVTLGNVLSKLCQTTDGVRARLETTYRI